MQDTTLTLPVPPLAHQLARAFAARGEEIFLVGGAVREALLGNQPHELDFATSALPRITDEIVAELGIGPTYRVGEKFGTIGVATDNLPVEITTYRSLERYSPGSRKPEVEFGKSLADDVTRRDFTINAIAQNPSTGVIVDILDGVDDLRRRRIRAVGKPEDRFADDPLRLLRAVRFACRLDFTIEPVTRSALSRCAQALERISRERVRDECSKILQSDGVIRGLTLLRDSSLLAHSVPELCALDEMKDHGPRHPLSLWEHTMRVIAGVSPRLPLRWAALLHDIAKPTTRTIEPGGRPRFFHHEEVGAEMAREILTGLRYPGAVIDAVALLVETHMQLHAYSDEWSDGALRRLMLRLGPLMDDSIELAFADGAGHTETGASGNARKLARLKERVDALSLAPPQVMKSPLSGDELMRRYGREPGPWIREIKDALLTEVLEGRVEMDDVEAAWALADDLVQSGP